MKIAVLGGGFTGLTTSYYLAKKGYEVTLFEKEKILGGLAVGFKQPNWDWYLERAYHHLLDSEDDILRFAKDVGFEEIFFKETDTASLYEVSNFQFPISKQIQNNKYRIFPFDSPSDLLRFPLLSFPEKIRAGIVLAFLKASPFLSLYEKQTAEEFLKKTMGNRAWEVLWQQLFRKKFGKYAGNVLTSFIWARIKKRAKQLGYITGGFQTFINHVVEKNKTSDVHMYTNHVIEQIEKRGDSFQIHYSNPVGIKGHQTFDKVVSTLPTVIMGKITKSFFPSTYLNRFMKLKYLHAVVLILETKEPILKNIYWLNICTGKIPLMLVAQHTNFIDKKHYGGNHVAYIGWYVEREDPLMKMDKESVLKFVLPHLKSISNYQLTINNYFLFHGPFAQPIFDKEFIKNKPDFETPAKNFFIANLDMTYPYDRGTNYAVKLGREVSDLL